MVTKEWGWGGWNYIIILTSLQYDKTLYEQSKSTKDFIHRNTHIHHTHTSWHAGSTHAHAGNTMVDPNAG